MKKSIFLLGSLFAAVILSGCGLLDKANGILLYGDKENVLASMKEEHKGQVDKKYLSIKILEDEDKRILVMDESSAKYLMDTELLREVVDGSDTEAVTSLPELAQGEGFLFAKNEDREHKVAGQEVKLAYEGNVIIGDGRVYTDMFQVVTDGDFKAMDGAEKTLGIIKYDKDPDGIGGFDVEKEQLVKIEE